jgi:hypothetical protein
MLKPTAITSRSAERAKKEKKRPSPRLTKAPVQSQDATRRQGKTRPSEGNRARGSRDQPLGRCARKVGGMGLEMPAKLLLGAHFELPGPFA